MEKTWEERCRYWWAAARKARAERDACCTTISEQQQTNQQLQKALLDCIETFGITPDSQFWAAYTDAIAQAKTAMAAAEEERMQDIITEYYDDRANGAYGRGKWPKV